MEKVTGEQFQELRRMFWEPGNKGPCPIWPDLSAWTIQTRDPASPKRFWSPRTGGVFVIPDGVSPDHLTITDEETRKRDSS